MEKFRSGRLKTFLRSRWKNPSVCVTHLLHACAGKLESANQTSDALSTRILNQTETVTRTVGVRGLYSHIFLYKTQINKRKALSWGEDEEEVSMFADMF